jgi:hypothetical protein
MQFNNPALTKNEKTMTTLLLNEFLKEHRKVEEQQATIAELTTSSAKQAVTVAQEQR